MRILVTGAAGFIGRHVVRALRARHPRAVIVGLDSYWTGSRDLIEGASGVIEADIGSLSLMDRRLYSQIWHLASPASPVHYQARPLDTIRANVVGTLRCLDWLEPGGKILLASTSEVYGEPLESPQSESYRGSVSTTGPRACYDESKRCAETVLCDARRQHGVSIKIVRLFNVYGPGTLIDDGRAVSNFVGQALRGRDLTVYGGGHQTRAFTYISDVVRGLMAVMNDTPDDFTGPMNLGTDRETTILEIAEFVQRLCCTLYRTESQIVHLPALPDDPTQRLPDLSLAMRTIGWSPADLVPWESGILWTATDFQRRYG